MPTSSDHAGALLFMMLPTKFSRIKFPLRRQAANTECFVRLSEIMVGSLSFFRFAMENLFKMMLIVLQLILNKIVQSVYVYYFFKFYFFSIYNKIIKSFVKTERNGLRCFYSKKSKNKEIFKRKVECTPKYTWKSAPSICSFKIKHSFQCKKWRKICF